MIFARVVQIAITGDWVLNVVLPLTSWQIKTLKIHDVQLRFVSSATTRNTTLDEIFDQLFQTYILIKNEKKKYKKKKYKKKTIKERLRKQSAQDSSLKRRLV